ncbi:hypothetical protein B0J11DRAFT_183648 [Dendryphion nanum]|uniref:Fungal N-terminal domain-containing protein n=1 Tax=Dendryphion nanum TaxID=256645 RepID=A0A9P9D545_9PLEO|nr:hypothetical protein B0J11DRAFT_183648 [Dendryphion nanum]
MAEIIGLAASIIQIAGAGASLSKSLYNYVGSAVCADQQLADIAGDVEITANALDSVGEVFQDETSSSTVSKKAVIDAHSLIKRCESVFAEIHRVIEKRRRPTTKEGKKGLSAFGKLSWPLKEQKIQLLQTRLESLKNSLILLFHVLQLANVQASGKVEKSALEKERDIIRHLYERQQQSLKVLHTLESKLDRVSLDDQDTLCGSDSGIIAQVPTINMMLQPSLPKSNSQPDSTLSADDSGMSESDGSISDDDAEHLTFEDLSKCAKHVQRLLKDISTLQRSLDSSESTSHPRRRGVRKIYRRFCRKFESNLASNGTSALKPSLGSGTVLPLDYLNLSQTSHKSSTGGVLTPENVRSAASLALPEPVGSDDIASSQSTQVTQLNWHARYQSSYVPLPKQNPPTEATTALAGMSAPPILSGDGGGFGMNPAIDGYGSRPNSVFALGAYRNIEKPIPDLHFERSDTKSQAQQMFERNLQILENNDANARNYSKEVKDGFPPAGKKSTGPQDEDIFAFGDSTGANDVLESFDFDSFLHDSNENQTTYDPQESNYASIMDPSKTFVSYSPNMLASHRLDISTRDGSFVDSSPKPSTGTNQASGSLISGMRCQRSPFPIQNLQPQMLPPSTTDFQAIINEAVNPISDYTEKVLKPELASRQKDTIEQGLPSPTEEQLRAQRLRDYQMGLMILVCGGDQSKRKRMYRISDYDAPDNKTAPLITPSENFALSMGITGDSRTFEYGTPVETAPVFLNAKQFGRIVKRRMERQAFEQRLLAAEQARGTGESARNDSEGEKSERSEDEDEENRESHHEHNKIVDRNVDVSSGASRLQDSKTHGDPTPAMEIPPQQWKSNTQRIPYDQPGLIKYIVTPPLVMQFQSHEGSSREHHSSKRWPRQRNVQRRNPLQRLLRPLKSTTTAKDLR